MDEHENCKEEPSRLEAKVKELEEHLEREKILSESAQNYGLDLEKERDKWKADYERAVVAQLDRDLKNMELAAENARLRKKFEAAVEVHIKHRFLCQTFHRDEEEKMTMKDLEKEFLKEIEERMKNEHSEN